MNVAPYTAISLLGRGGMGAVVHARAPDGREVALKVLLGSRDAESIVRFARERRMLASLGEAQGFVPLLDAGRCAAGPYVAMPVLSGGTLRERLRRGPLPVDEVIELGQRLAGALAWAHAHGVVHRDLKPENVLFDGQGQAFVADLGLAKHFARDGTLSESVSLSITGTVMGTIGYMAPEQMEDTKRAAAPADVFSLGAILFECLSGDPPFKAPDTVSLMTRLLEGEHPPLRKACPEAPAWLVDVVERAIRPDPAARYADAGALLEALETPPEPEGSAGARVWGLAGAALLGSLILGAVLVSRNRERAESTAATPPAPVASTAPPPSGDPAPSPTPPPPKPRPRTTSSSLPRSMRPLANRRGPLRLRSVWGNARGQHGALVTAVAFSPDGRYCVSGALDMSARLWDAESGDEVRAFPPREQVWSVAFSRDGKRVLVGGERTVSVFDAQTGRRRHRIPHSGRVYGVASLPDGEHAVSVDARGETSKWSIATGRVVDTQSAGVPLKYLRCARTTPLLLAGGTRTVLWDLDRNRTMTIRNDGRPTQECAISADGKQLLLANEDGTITHHRLDTKQDWNWRAVTRGETPWRYGYCRAVAFSPDGKQLYSGGADRRVRVWDAASHALLADLRGHTSWVHALAVSPDGTRIVSGGNDAVVRMWDLRRRRQLWPGEVQPAGGALVNVVSVGRQRVATAGLRVHVWDTRTGKARDLGPTTLRNRATAVAISPDDQRVAACNGKQVRVWSTESGKLLGQRDDLPAGARSLAWLGDGSLVIGAGRWLRARGEVWGTLLVWDDLSRRPRTQRRPSYGKPVQSIVLLRGRRFVAADYDGTIQVWHSKQDAPLARMRDPQGVIELAVSADETLLVTSSPKNTIGVWDLGQRRKLRTIARHPGSISSLTVTSDAKLAATLGGDRVLRLWDLERGKLRDQIDVNALDADRASVAFTRDDRSLLLILSRGPVLRFDVRR